MVKKSELICGVHSKIPLCCVFWYLSDLWGRDSDLKNDWLHHIGCYIMCPDCMIRYFEHKLKPKRVSKCNCEGLYWLNMSNPTNPVYISNAKSHIIYKGSLPKE